MYSQSLFVSNVTKLNKANLNPNQQMFFYKEVLFKLFVPICMCVYGLAWSCLLCVCVCGCGVGMSAYTKIQHVKRVSRVPLYIIIYMHKCTFLYIYVHTPCG